MHQKILGIVANIWKLRNIVALFKKGARTDPGNYRLVSLTSIICEGAKTDPGNYRLVSLTNIICKGAKTDPGNYRPVSLTSIICKLMEKLVRNQIVSHMTKNKLFSKKQFGFISGRKTTLQRTS